MKWNKAYRILRFISKYPEGVRFTDIQKFIVKMNGLRWTKARRGYYCTRLLGNNDFLHGQMYHKPGILHDFCAKGPDGLWRINSLITGKCVLQMTTGKIIFKSRRKKGRI